MRLDERAPLDRVEPGPDLRAEQFELQLVVLEPMLQAARLVNDHGRGGTAAPTAAAPRSRHAVGTGVFSSCCSHR